MNFAVGVTPPQSMHLLDIVLVSKIYIFLKWLGVSRGYINIHKWSKYMQIPCAKEMKMINMCVLKVS